MKVLPIILGTIFFVQWHSFAVAANALNQQQLNAVMQKMVQSINSRAPISSGDWTFLKANFNLSKKVIYYSVRDRTITASQISSAEYKRIMTEPLLADVCKKQTTFKKYGVDVVYNIRGNRGKRVAEIYIDTAKCR